MIEQSILSAERSVKKRKDPQLAVPKGKARAKAIAAGRCVDLDSTQLEIRERAKQFIEIDTDSDDDNFQAGRFRLTRSMCLACLCSFALVVEAVQKTFKSGKMSQEDKKMERDQKRQQIKDDKVLKQLATKGHRILDPLMPKLETFNNKITKEEPKLDKDTVESFRSAKSLLGEWHLQSQTCLGKICKGELLQIDALGYDSDKTLAEQVRNVKDLQKALNVALFNLKPTKPKK